MLRDEIAEIIYRHELNIKHHPYVSGLDVADAILSLIRSHELDSPSDFIAVKECPTKEHYTTGDCDYCHGSGRIERRMSVREVMEFVKFKIEIGHDYLPNGERVELSKK
jgi:hypothetical protein